MEKIEWSKIMQALQTHYGMAEINGKKYTLIDYAEAQQDGRYSATAIDPDETPDVYGNRTKYIIYWTVTPDGEQYIREQQEEDEILGIATQIDESRLCDWDTPDEIEERDFVRDSTIMNAYKSIPKYIIEMCK